MAQSKVKKEMKVTCELTFKASLVTEATTEKKAKEEAIRVLAEAYKARGIDGKIIVVPTKVEISRTGKSISKDSGEGGKYEFTGETKELDGHTLNRIRAVRKITDPNVEGWVVKVGELGGWIESEKNLSHDGAAWVGDDACVYGDAKVYDNGYVSDNAHVSDNAKVYGNGHVCDEANVYGDAQVYGDAEVYGRAQVSGHAEVRENADIFDDAEVYGEAKVGGEATVCGKAKVYDDAIVCGNSQVYGDANVCYDANVYDDATVCGNAWVYGEVGGVTVVGGETGETAEPDTDDTLRHRTAALERLVGKLADEMKATGKDIKAIKQKLNM